MVMHVHVASKPLILQRHDVTKEHSDSLAHDAVLRRFVVWHAESQQLLEGRRANTSWRHKPRMYGVTKWKILILL